MINKILFITLSNIGDVILTLPSLDALREAFPRAKITCIVGPRPKEVFEGNPFIERTIVFDKQSTLKEKVNLIRQLRSEHFDLVVDLRNSVFGVFIPAKYKISHFLRIPKNIQHMRDRHLYKVNTLLSKMHLDLPSQVKETSLFIQPQARIQVKNFLQGSGLTEQEKIVIVSVGAKSHIKRWPREKFSELVRRLVEDLGVKVILTGDKDDAATAEYVRGHCGFPVLDLSSKTSLGELAYLLKNSSLLISNDSATLHLASYFNLPVLAIFGPTNEKKYGPWSDNAVSAKKDIFCRPCERAQCIFKTLNCTSMIRVEDVLRLAKQMLVEEAPFKPQEDFRRILIVRTDRIGDVILSTPVIKALKMHYPFAYIAMMVAPQAKDIVEGNPYLDEVITYDKDGKHKSWFESMKFSQAIKKKKFDLAVILHPTNRVHLVTFFAGIKRRLGYNRKLGILLTDGVNHTKQYGEKHELEYNLDLLRVLGIEAEDKKLFMPIKNDSENWADELFKEKGISLGERLLAIHPAASCPSKIWPQERFAEVADRLVDAYGFKVLLVGGPKDIALAQGVSRHMLHEAINLAGKTSLSQLASILKRCRLFISNDSGPVHIGSAVGVPVISIFGRSQRGLSPLRWGPVGEKDKFAHQNIGCVECLAHNCVKNFACLKAVTTDYILELADSILM
ncbi:MAG: lipopolysaccharide heptosyltransferase II [Candidatus Omnitrophica bacterium]|nr:lipopolysaccharide heptosyltransferase II [Candidatus Omnitrophota bacterium]MDD5652806.1 lipopolysaccharide heptosyltransferase II [Candidatus Omnitrophota bacterium]